MNRENELGLFKPGFLVKIFTWPQLQWYPRILVEAPCYLKPNSTDKERLRATKGHRFWGTSAGYGSKRVAPKFGG